MVAVTVRLLSLILCAFGGYRVSALLNEEFIAGRPQRALALAAGIVLGLLFGYLIGGILGRYLARLVGRLEAYLANVSGGDILFAAAGALAGLLLALLPSTALFHFGYPGYVVSVILFFAAGLLGTTIALSKRPELQSLFRPASGEVGDGFLRRALVLDTSVIIDGRLVGIAKAGFLGGRMVVPRFVLQELQSIADSDDELKRNRGRRGLEVLNALQRLENVEIEIADHEFPEEETVDTKLTALSRLTGYALATNDFNLSRLAELQGVRVLNINNLANALKPVVLPGERLSIKIIREGKEPGQGVGYLGDGTMVVVENAGVLVGKEVGAVATSVLQTPAGKMIFASLGGAGGEE